MTVWFGQVQKSILAALFELDFQETFEIRDATNVRSITPALEEGCFDLEKPVARIGVTEQVKIFGEQI